MQDGCYYTYIVASRTHILYIGVTGNIERRINQHKNPHIGSFTGRYNCNRLVWLERYTSASSAIAREKQLKRWRRAKKIELIETQNPTWIDLQRKLGKVIS